MSDAASDFHGLKSGTPWLEFVKRMENDEAARTAFAAILQLTELSVDGDVATFLASPTVANFQSALSNSPAFTTVDVGLATGTSLELTSHLTVAGSLTGSIDITPTGSTGEDVHVTTAAQTVGAATVTIPNMGGTTDDFVMKALAQTLTNKTLTSPVIGTGLTASGSAANDFSASTGTFKTSSGTNTLSGTTALAANKDISCASGTTAVDFSGGSGTWKTTTGVHTMGGLMKLKIIATPVAATGAAGGVAGAAALGAANIQTVSSDGATKGVKFATSAAGEFRFILNTSSTACNLFAASGGTINGGSADAGCAIPASKGVIAFSTAADTWTVFDFTAQAGAAA